MTTPRALRSRRRLLLGPLALASLLAGHGLSSPGTCRAQTAAPTAERAAAAPTAERAAATPPAPPQSPPAPFVLPSHLAPAPGVAAQAPLSTAPPRRPTSVTDSWWFWASIGGVVVVTVAVLAIASGGPSTPKTQLGDMEAFRGGR
jgi:hypothetical protein